MIFPLNDLEDSLEFKVPYRLMGKARPRMSVGKNGKAHVFMPQKYMVHVQDIQWVLRSVMFDKPNFFSTEASYAFVIKLIRKRRQPKSKKEAAIFDTVIPPGSFAQGKPDWDNAAGTMADAGNGILYGDDDQVVAAVVYRVFGDEDAAYITVHRLRDKVAPRETLNMKKPSALEVG